MFEDLIPNKHIKPGIYKFKDKDSLIDSLKDNVDAKEEMIFDLLGELNNKNMEIEDLRKELDYLRDL